MKKILSSIIIFVLLISSASYASIPLSLKEELKDYGIITNFEIKTVSRAEAAKIIMASLGFGDAERKDTIFTDVKEPYWASGYIELANSIGIINGKGDGTFAPEEKVTNEQMVKMLVCALGYESFVRTGYPTGYMMVASQRGITEGLDLKGSDIASREDVAVMINNALDIPLVKQTDFGDRVEYAIMDGTAGTKKSTLRINLEAKDK